MDKKERKELMKLKLFAQKDDDGIFESLFQSLFLAIIFGLFVMFLWNALLPEIFKFPEINYLQSVGLIVLTRLIFGGIAFGHKSGVSRKSHNRNKKLMGLSKIDDISDWKYYDTYWEEEGKEQFEEYKSKKKDTNNNDM
jgi:hypothetical protein